jgi:hypothetical protein
MGESKLEAELEQNQLGLDNKFYIDGCSYSTAHSIKMGDFLKERRVKRTLV